MPDNATPPLPPVNPPPNAAAPAPQTNAGHIPITEELDSAKWTLPPIVPLLVAVIALSNRTKPSGSMAITKIVAADQQGNTMAAIQVKIDNGIEKPLWIK